MDWIGWIKGCLQPTLVSILVNGSPTTKFNTQKGLRQDNPLAPFLFLMVVESLIGLIRQAMVANKFYGVKVGKDLMVSMLQFEDDTLMFGDVTLENMLCVKSALRCFELVSRLKVKFQKSKLGGICVDELIVKRFASLLNCRVMDIPFVYLGISIWTNPRKVDTWHPII